MEAPDANGGPGVADPGSGANNTVAFLVTELEALGFVDAAAVVEHHGSGLVADAVAYVRAKPGIANPGAYLRNMLRNGRVPPLPATAGSPARGAPAANDVREAPAAGAAADFEVVALRELLEILGQLPDGEREAITEAVDASVAADPWAARSTWMADGCRHRLLQQALSDSGHLHLAVAAKAAGGS